LAGGLLHILNHSLFKPLLFFGAGGIIHSTGTRIISRMGGLAKGMGISSILFFIGAIAICGLPPLNGFSGEFLLYLGFFREAMNPAPILALGVPALGLVGGMAAITFVKLYGMVFLGAPRSPEPLQPHELPKTMLIPMLVLALFCVAGGVAPLLFMAMVRPVIAMLTPLSSSYVNHIPKSLSLFPIFGCAIAIAALIIWLIARSAIKGRKAGVESTWGCGYLSPTPRMQYTGGSFSEFWGTLTAPLSRTITRAPAPAGIAPQAEPFIYEPEETLLEKILRPIFYLTGVGCAFIRRLQHGQLHIYMLYIFITLILLISWVR
jgi:hydrogenase-4 component B